MALYDNIDWEGARRRRRRKVFAWIFNTLLFFGTGTLIVVWYDWKLLLLFILFVWANNNQLWLQGKFNR